MMRRATYAVMGMIMVTACNVGEMGYNARDGATVILPNGGAVVTDSPVYMHIVVSVDQPSGTTANPITEKASNVFVRSICFGCDIYDLAPGAPFEDADNFNNLRFQGQIYTFVTNAQGFYDLFILLPAPEKEYKATLGADIGSSGKTIDFTVSPPGEEEPAGG